MKKFFVLAIVAISVALYCFADGLITAGGSTISGIIGNFSGSIYNSGWGTTVGVSTNHTTSYKTNIFNGGYSHTVGNATNEGTLRVTNGVVVPSAGGLKLGTGTTITNILTASAALTFTAVSAQTSQDQSISVAGTTTNDVATVGIPFQVQGAGAINSTFTCFASNDVVWVRYNNYSSATRSTNGVFKVCVIKF